MTIASDQSDIIDTLPDYVQEYLNSRPDDLEAYKKMVSDIEKEKNKDIKEFMIEIMFLYCKEKSMSLQYIYETYWREWIKEQRVLQKRMQPMELYIAIEEILARQADSSKYTNQRSRRRRTLMVPGHPCEERKPNGVDRNVSQRRFLESYYAFGSHQFFVGRAIDQIIQCIEDRYGLDFKKLENARWKTDGPAY